MKLKFTRSMSVTLAILAVLFSSSIVSYKLGYKRGIDYTIHIVDTIMDNVEETSWRINGQPEE